MLNYLNGYQNWKKNHSHSNDHGASAVKACAKNHYTPSTNDSTRVLKCQRLMIRHFVATGYVVHNGCILLHWHVGVGEWLPPGGHIEPNEDPVGAVRREVHEETGLRVDILPYTRPLLFIAPTQLEPPITILVEDVEDKKYGLHQHIDFVYFTRLSDASATAVKIPPGWVWLSQAQLVNRTVLSNRYGAKPPPEDVVLLGLKALKIYGSHTTDD